MREEKKIKQMLVEGVGWIYESDGRIDDHNPVEPFQVNGEMALITWYRQGNKEFNGKYVIEIEYYETSNPHPNEK